MDLTGIGVWTLQEAERLTGTHRGGHRRLTERRTMMQVQYWELFWKGVRREIEGLAAFRTYSLHRCNNNARICSLTNHSCSQGDRLGGALNFGLIRACGQRCCECEASFVVREIHRKGF
jgi:hypothetical protein